MSGAESSRTEVNTIVPPSGDQGPAVIGGGVRESAHARSVGVHHLDLVVLSRLIELLMHECDPPPIRGPVGSPVGSRIVRQVALVFSGHICQVDLVVAVLPPAENVILPSRVAVSIAPVSPIGRARAEPERIPLCRSRPQADIAITDSAAAIPRIQPPGFPTPPMPSEVPVTVGYAACPSGVPPITSRDSTPGPDGSRWGGPDRSRSPRMGPGLRS